MQMMMRLMMMSWAMHQDEEMDKEVECAECDKIRFLYSPVLVPELMFHQCPCYTNTTSVPYILYFLRIININDRRILSAHALLYVMYCMYGMVL
jgi:hypothetical protein